MRETVLAALILIGIVFAAGVSGNFAFAKTAPTNTKHTEKKITDNTKALAEETRKRALEKSLKEVLLKKADLKKQLALEAKSMQDAKKKTAVYGISESK